MRKILSNIKQMLIRFISRFRTAPTEDASTQAQESIDNLNTHLEELKKLVARVAAAEYNLECDLTVEREWLEHLESANGSVADIEASRAKVNELQSGLADARVCHEQAKEQVLRFQNELRLASERIRDAQFRRSLADLRIQSEKIAFESSLQANLAALERVESHATQTESEADAAAEVNALFGIGEAESGETPK